MGSGYHFGFYKKHPIIVKYFASEDSIRKYISITILNSSDKTIQSFSDDILKYIHDKEKSDPGVCLYVSTLHAGKSSWTRLGKNPYRSEDTIFTKNNEVQRIVDHIRTFENNRQATIDAGLPNRTGVLMYGSPGVGP